MTEDITKSAIEMYNYHGQLGLERMELRHCTVVRDLINPDVWSSNRAFNIKASSANEISELMQEVDAVFAGLSYRHFVVDPRTPTAFEAYLALNDYSESSVILQMVLEGALKTRADMPEAKIWPVATDADWSALRNLVLIDHAEGARTKTALSEAVTDGIVAGYRAKEGQCQFFLAEFNGQTCAYGSGINGPNGMGMVEDLFTLPELRGRGLASKLISCCVEFCRDRGAERILIGSHATEPPKHLYNKLGFNPAFLTRDFIKHS